MIGTGLTKHEADVRLSLLSRTAIDFVFHQLKMLTRAFETELRKFDSERVFPAWDGLVMKQQATLEGVGVPTMFVTDVPRDRERQQRVIQVLEGITV